MDGCQWTKGVERTKPDRWTLMDVKWKLTDIIRNCDGQQQMAMLTKLRPNDDEWQRWWNYNERQRWQNYNEQQHWWNYDERQRWRNYDERQCWRNYYEQQHWQNYNQMATAIMITTNGNFNERQQQWMATTITMADNGQRLRQTVTITNNDGRRLRLWRMATMIDNNHDDDGLRL